MSTKKLIDSFLCFPAITKEGTKKQLFDHFRILTIPSVFAHEAVWTDILEITFLREISGCKSNLEVTNKEIRFV